MAQQWEYKKLMDKNQDELNELGRQGWELASTTLNSNDNSEIMIFKRPKEIEKTRDSYGRDGR